MVKLLIVYISSENMVKLVNELLYRCILWVGIISFILLKIMYIKNKPLIVI